MIAKKNEDVAITRFKNSLQKTDKITNSIARKTLLRMHEIFILRQNDVIVNMDEKTKNKR